jgi:phage shock protein PspC (stress-responsive transcriptional regulator)
MVTRTRSRDIGVPEPISQGPSRCPGGAPTGTLIGMDSSDVKVTLKDMWETRPSRPRDDRKFAGVGAAIARRYDLDPVLVRVGLVAAAFTGVGVGLYIAGWILLPDEPTDGSVPRRRRPPLWALIVLGILVAASIGHLANDPSGFLLPLAAVAAILFLLHRSRAGRGIPGPATPQVAAMTSGPTTAGTTPGSTAEGDTPPAWDPLGAAPFAWDLPEPGPAPAPPPRPKSRVTPVTLAITLLAAGVTALLLLATGGLSDVPVLLGVVLTVLGGGLVVGSVLRSGRGLIPFALLAMAVTWGVLAVPFDRISAGPPRDLHIAPVSAAALAPRYDNPVGSIEMDLRTMDLTVPAGAAATPVATRVDTGMGSVEIWVPENADVRFTGTAGVGSIEFGDQESSGPDARLQVDDLGADGVASGRPIVLDAHAGAGSVEVHRG